MKTRSMLVAFPGNPFSIKALCPNTRLAYLAGALERSGHTTTILDYGTIETLDRLFTPTFRNAAQRVADTVFTGQVARPFSAMTTLWELRGMRRTLRAELASLLDDVTRTIVSKAPLDFVVFSLNVPQDVTICRAIAERLVSAQPGIRLVACGPLVEWAGASCSWLIEHFSFLLTQHAEHELLRWAEGRAFVDPSPQTGADALPLPSYANDTYPALLGDSKIRLFEVESSRDVYQRTFVDAASSPFVRSAESVCSEMEYLTESFGARAFCLTGGAIAFDHMEHVAQEILARGLGVRYCRTGAIHNPKGVSFSAPVFNRIKTSGCRAVDFELNTGSQWMLDDYYGSDFGITEAEHILRASKFAGLFTVERFIYPAPADDYHSRAETVRLIERTQPDSVQISLPWALPSSARETKRNDRDTDRANFLKVTCRKQADLLSPDLETYWAAPRVVRESESLVNELDALGFETGLNAETALIARLSGYEGRERDFSMLMLRHFFAGDVSSIASAVERFNRRMENFAKNETRKKARPLLAVVGN